MCRFWSQGRLRKNIGVHVVVLKPYNGSLGALPKLLWVRGPLPSLSRAHVFVAYICNSVTTLFIAQ